MSYLYMWYRFMLIYINFTLIFSAYRQRLFLKLLRQWTHKMSRFLSHLQHSRPCCIGYTNSRLRLEFRILQHFATKLWNITNFVMLFQAVMKFLSRLVEFKILVNVGLIHWTQWNMQNLKTFQNMCMAMAWGYCFVSRTVVSRRCKTELYINQ
jgi:hypothetical protein